MTTATAWTTEEPWAGTRLPIEQAKSLPAQAYTDQDFFDLEREQVFAGGWVAIALLDELMGGRILVREVADRSILLTRNRDGELRAFLNSCRHRGTQLASQDCSVANTIRCPYHRWGYNLDGQLVATPQFDEAGIADFDKSDFPLHKVRVATSGCLVYVCLDPDATSLDHWLGDLAARTRGYGLERWRVIETQTVTIAANWKLIAENFQEYYHLAWVHPQLAKVSRVQDHYRFQGPGMYCGQTTTPVSSDDRDDWTAMAPAAGLSESDAASGRFLSVFPNALLSVLPNHAFVMVLRPVSPGVTIETCTWLVPPSTGEIPTDAFAQTREFWLDVNGEDIEIVERGQAGLTKGGFVPGRLSPRFEEPLHRFHNMLADRFVGLDRVPAGDPNDADPRYGTGANPLPYLG